MLPMAKNRIYSMAKPRLTIPDSSWHRGSDTGTSRPMSVRIQRSPVQHASREFRADQWRTSQPECGPTPSATLIVTPSAAQENPDESRSFRRACGISSAVQHGFLLPVSLLGSDERLASRTHAVIGLSTLTSSIVVLGRRMSKSR